MGDERFKLPRSSYEELTKIIKAYAHEREPVTLEDVSKTTALHPTIISGNVGFLVGIEVLEGGSKKQATARGHELGQALEHEMPDEIRKFWRLTVSTSPFLQRVLTAIRIRKGMDEAALLSHIAYSAGQPNKAWVMTGARTVVDVLRAAELVKEDNGRFLALDTGQQMNVEPPTFIHAEMPVAELSVQQPAPTIATTHAAPTRSKPVVQLHFHINVTCEPTQLDSLASQIARIVAGFRDSHLLDDDANLNSDGG